MRRLRLCFFQFSAQGHAACRVLFPLRSEQRFDHGNPSEHKRCEKGNGGDGKIEPQHLSEYHAVQQIDLEKLDGQVDKKRMNQINAPGAGRKFGHAFGCGDGQLQKQDKQARRQEADEQVGVALRRVPEQRREDAGQNQHGGNAEARTAADAFKRAGGKQQAEADIEQIGAQREIDVDLHRRMFPDPRQKNIQQKQKGNQNPLLARRARFREERKQKREHQINADDVIDKPHVIPQVAVEHIQEGGLDFLQPEVIRRKHALEQSVKEPDGKQDDDKLPGLLPRKRVGIGRVLSAEIPGQNEKDGDGPVHQIMNGFQRVRQVRAQHALIGMHGRRNHMNAHHGKRRQKPQHIQIAHLFFFGSHRRFVRTHNYLLSIGADSPRGV